jgi:hypothetical protein
MSDKQSTDTPKDDDALLKRARDMFSRCKDAEDHNRQTAQDDIRFARLGEQWPAEIVEQRKRESRPCLTINRLPAFIRQVVNDARQNKPSIRVHPADSAADPETAEIINGLIRNIEYTSDADVAYDTGVECAVTGGFGYWRVDLDYSYDDSFDLDIKIGRISNPLSVYGDPNSTAADSSDWNVAFVTEVLSNEEFKLRYPDASHVDWEDTDAWSGADDWHDNGILVAEWWEREEVESVIYKTVDGIVLSQERIETDEDIQGGIESGMIQFQTDRSGQPIKRTVKSHKVTQRIISGLEVLETNEWPGRYIPIIPVYGDEIVVDGKRHFRSLVHDAIDPQRMFNYWRTTSTELVALAPRVPFIGPEGAFDADPEKWASINTRSHGFVEYSRDSVAPPQRQPLDAGPAAGALQEAMLASDDMKSIIGLYDASLGARSNETSGRAIMARQREGDVSTFHFIDNESRAIRHTGRVVIDLIPSVYNTERIIRVLGEDGNEKQVKINGEYQKIDDKTGQPMREPVQGPDGQPMRDEDGNELMRAVMALHDLSAGKYDLTVTTGPSFTTRREEAAFQMTEMMRALPASAPIIGKHLAKNLDWPGADEIAEELEAMMPSPDTVPRAQVEQMMNQGKQVIAQLQERIKELEGNQALDAAKLQEDQRSNMAGEAIDAYQAETQRMGVVARPVQQAAI